MKVRMVALALSLGCAEELTLPVDPALPIDPVDEPDPDAPAGWWRPLGVDGDVTTVRIDATSHAEWRTIDLSAPSPVAVEDPATSLAWHLAVRRFNLAINGGVSGPGALEAAFVPGAAIDGPISLPSDGWRTDDLDASSDPPGVDHALGDWYHYDPSTHVLTPRRGVYAIRSADAVWAVQIASYYDEAGNSGFPTLGLRALVR
jgi:hypothetical protein